MNDSRIPKFYQLSVRERLRTLQRNGTLNDDDYAALSRGTHVLDALSADRLVENVIGSFGLPMGLGLNFRVNQRDYLVPMVVEEPSIIAAVSSAAKRVRRAGGFTSVAQTPMLVGQIQVVDVPNMVDASAKLLEHAPAILDRANAMHPNMVARGGGAKDLEVVVHEAHPDRAMLVANLIVDTRNAMGANLVNTMCEGVAPLIADITGGRVLLRILSNLTDRAIVRSQAVIPTRYLGAEGEGEAVRDGIIVANDFAINDVYRAVTHNKGIMNGVDAVAIATGNDWRAIEASAHAYAARSGRYLPLTSWSKNDAGDLVGEIKIPLKVGTVGGQIESNPAVGIAHRILGATSAIELAEVMAAVGLGQNFAALKALATDGIQSGHLRLHARSVAAAAGAGPAVFETVVRRLIDGGDIKVWKARRIVESLASKPQTRPIPVVSDAAALAPPSTPTHDGVGYGKIILFGEHAVVHGSHAIAAPIGLSVSADVTEDAPKPGVVFASSVGRAPLESEDFSQKIFELIVERLDVVDRRMRAEISSLLPHASGLGASAALSVSMIRAVSHVCDMGLSDTRVSELAFECETIVHGTPSGIDNTVATFGRPTLFKRTDQAGGHETKDIVVPSRIPVIIGLTGVRSLTSNTVGMVNDAWKRNPRRYESLFREIDSVTLEGKIALENGNLEHIGDLMNINHGLLSALQISSPELEDLVAIARRCGAMGAKLTGGGGGGAMIAIAEHEQIAAITSAMSSAGFANYVTSIR